MKTGVAKRKKNTYKGSLDSGETSGMGIIPTGSGLDFEWYPLWASVFPVLKEGVRPVSFLL